MAHDVRHSFYWVLLWVVLRHTAHNSPCVWGRSTSDSCANVFKQGDSHAAASAKRNWFWHWEDLVITGNAALTELMLGFGALMRESVVLRRAPTLEYDAVLEVFDRALARQDWPKSKDGPVSYTLPTLVPVNGRLFGDAMPKKHHAPRHAGKGKEGAVVSESDSDDEIDEDDFDEAYESDASSADDADVAPHGLNLLSQNAGHLLIPQTQKLLERFRMGDGDDDDSEDAAEVSAPIGYDEDDED